MQRDMTSGDKWALSGADWGESGSAFASAAKAAAIDNEKSLAELTALLPVIKNNINKKDPHEGDTLLITAALAGNAGASKLLIDNGAEPNLANTAGYTPLHAAARFGSANCVRVLLMHGASARAELPDGRTAYDLAVAAKEDAEKAKLEAASGERLTPERLSRSSAHHRPEMVVELLKAAEDAQFERDEQEAVESLNAAAEASVQRAVRKLSDLDLGDMAAAPSAE